MKKLFLLFILGPILNTNAVNSKTGPLKIDFGGLKRVEFTAIGWVRKEKPARRALNLLKTPRKYFRTKSSQNRTWTQEFQSTRRW